MTSVSVLIFSAFGAICCCSQTFMQLPDEVVSHKILSSLSITDKTQSIFSLSRRSNHHFHSFHDEEITLYKQLLFEIRNLAYSSLNKIENLCKELRFTEIWSLMLPNILREASKQYSYEMESVLVAMNMHTISLSEFRQLATGSIRNSSSSELDILIFASRALLHYYIIGMFRV